MAEYLYSKETYNIRKAIFEVRKELGCGFMERVYQEALEYEFQVRGIPYEREKVLPILYKGHEIGEPYRADFVCYGKIIVELKAVQELNDLHRAQIINYLKVANMKLGLLVNFGEEFANIERFINM